MAAWHSTGWPLIFNSILLKWLDQPSGLDHLQQRSLCWPIPLGKIPTWILRSGHLALSPGVVRILFRLCLFWPCFRNGLSWPLTNWSPQLDPQSLTEFLFSGTCPLSWQEAFFWTCPDRPYTPTLFLLHFYLSSRPPAPQSPSHNSAPSFFIFILPISHLQFPCLQMHSHPGQISWWSTKRDASQNAHRDHGERRTHHWIPPLRSNTMLGTQAQEPLVKTIYKSLPSALLFPLPAIHLLIFYILWLLRNFPHTGFWFTAWIVYFYGRAANKKGKTLKMDFCWTLLTNEFL